MFLVRQIRRIRLRAISALRRYRGPNTPEARGRRLLRDWLSTPQREQFDTNEYFDVIGCDTGRSYRIYYDRAMNVHELDEAGRPKMGWCFLPKGYLVTGDVMLAQKIALETFEVGALKVAHRFTPNERRIPTQGTPHGNAPGHERLFVVMVVGFAGLFASVVWMLLN
jgi:hypothetical protein